MNTEKNAQSYKNTGEQPKTKERVAGMVCPATVVNMSEIAQINLTARAKLESVDVDSEQLTVPSEILKWYEDDFEQHVPWRRYLVYKSNEGQILGFIKITKENQIGYIQMLYVRPGYEAKGIGSQLITSALEILKARYKDIFLRVECSNQTAIEFYQKHGFEKATETPEEHRIGQVTHLVFRMTYKES